MAIIYEGDPNYQQNYPVLWVGTSDGLNLRETPGGTLIRTLPYETLIHYLYQYQDQGGYRWFKVRAWRTGDQWDVGWVAAYNYNTGVYNAKVLGIYYPNGQPPILSAEYRHVECRLETPVYSTWGVLQGTYGDLWGPNSGSCATWGSDPWYVFPIGNENISRVIVHYPGQESLYKPYLVSGKSMWFLAGGLMYAHVFCDYVDVWFLDSGIKSGQPYLRRIN